MYSTTLPVISSGASLMTLSLSGAGLATQQVLDKAAPNTSSWNVASPPLPPWLTRPASDGGDGSASNSDGSALDGASQNDASPGDSGVANVTPVSGLMMRSGNPPYPASENYITSSVLAIIVGFLEGSRR